MTKLSPFYHLAWNHPSLQQDTNDLSLKVQEDRQKDKMIHGSAGEREGSAAQAELEEFFNKSRRKNHDAKPSGKGNCNEGGGGDIKAAKAVK